MVIKFTPGQNVAKRDLTPASPTYHCKRLPFLLLASALWHWNICQNEALLADCGPAGSACLAAEHGDSSMSTFPLTYAATQSML